MHLLLPHELGSGGDQLDLSEGGQRVYVCVCVCVCVCFGSGADEQRRVGCQAGRGPMLHL